ncbi:MAG: CD225/dispanin family protein [Bacteroidales bacterium]|nr:CD225/dispanin family protein [Bacteroidales bacterium]MDD5816336.1 CD225/dispanin family protein [Bacteroidales bacterium]
MENQNSRPSNHLVWAILSTLFCCLPLGIVAIVYASKVDSLYERGDYSGAQDAADKAKNFVTWSAILAAICWVIYVIIVFVAAAGGFR